jgi:hypothetical protein
VQGAYRDLLSAAAGDRRGVYQTAAQDHSTSADLIEKDLMVCAVLDVLFGDVPDAQDKLVFKGGTSLSKAHGLISRFSEDVDLVVVRGQLGFGGDKDPMEASSAMSNKQRQRLIAELKKECSEYIAGQLLPSLDAAFSPLGARVEIDPDPGQEGQTILVHYESVMDGSNAYNLPTVKIEGGARSATLPAHAHTISPYVADTIGNPNLSTPDVITIDAERTFLDKLLILHGRHCHFRDKGIAYKNANRESRHYYDLAMMAGNVGANALGQPGLLKDVIHHSRLAFSSGWMRFDEAERGDLNISPPAALRSIIAADYAAMQGMIFGDAPSFDEVMARVDEIAATYAQSRQAA